MRIHEREAAIHLLLLPSCWPPNKHLADALCLAREGVTMQLATPFLPMPNVPLLPSWPPKKHLADALCLAMEGATVQLAQKLCAVLA